MIEDDLYHLQLLFLINNFNIYNLKNTVYVNMYYFIHFIKLKTVLTM